MDGKRVVGIVLWNIFNKIPIARKVGRPPLHFFPCGSLHPPFFPLICGLTSPRLGSNPIQIIRSEKEYDDLSQLSKLFNVHKDGEE